MRVLLVNKFAYLRSGTERYLFNLWRLLEDEGHEVALFSTADPRNVPTRFHHLFVPPIDFRRLTARAWMEAPIRVVWYPLAARRIARLVDEFRPHVAHLCNVYHHLSPSILPPLRARGIPVVHTLNDYKLVCPNYLLFTDGAPCTRCRGGAYVHALLHSCLGSPAFSALAALEMAVHRLTRVYVRHVRRFIAPSGFLRDLVVDWGIPRDKVSCVPHFAPAIHGRSTGEVIAYVGRLSREKGLEVLLEAMRRLPHIPLVVAGEGPLGSFLREKAVREEVSNVRFVGHLGDRALGELLAACRFTVIPSTWYEVFGLGTLESWSWGIPVVASRIGGLASVVRDRVDGLLVPPGDPSALAEAISWLWDHPTEASSMGEEGRRRLLDEFSPSSHWERLRRIYAEARG